MEEADIVLNLHEIIVELKIIENLLYLRTARTIVTVDENN
jgi:hypothetical protein